MSVTLTFNLSLDFFQDQDDLALDDNLEFEEEDMSYVQFWLFDKVNESAFLGRVYPENTWHCRLKCFILIFLFEFNHIPFNISTWVSSTWV